MAKINKDTETEIRRLASLPGHDRLGMIAKGCIVELLDELAELRASKTVTLAPAQVSEPLVLVDEEDEPEQWKSTRSSTGTFKDGLETGVRLGVSAGLTADKSSGTHTFRTTGEFKEEDEDDDSDKK